MKKVLWVLRFANELERLTAEGLQVEWLQLDSELGIALQFKSKTSSLH